MSPTFKISLSDWARLRYQAGAGHVSAQDDCVRLALQMPDDRHYANAQLDDYHANGTLRWCPPVRLQIRARFSHAASALRGTAGFGFWNDPFDMTETGGPRRWLPNIRLPQTVWFFFASSPSDMPLAMNVPGHGWKAATLDASTLWAKVLLPFAPVGMALFRWQWAYRRLWPLAQRILKVDEAQLPVEMEEWHTYQLDWEVDAVRFSVDDTEVLSTRHSPRGPLGLVIWIDNQTMVATPQGIFHSDVVTTLAQWMDIALLEVSGGSFVE